MADESFVEQALQDYEGALIGFIFGIVKDLETARDVVQDTFIKLYAQDQEKVKESLKTWLFTVARNRAFDILRRRKKLVEMEDEKLALFPSHGASPRRIADFRERVHELQDCLFLLSDNQREVILLKYQQGQSYAEISEVTGLSKTNVGFLLHSGIKRLRELIPADLLNQYQATALPAATSTDIQS